MPDVADQKPVLIIVAGPPATGKSDLAGKIAGEFGLPMITKDEFKEILAETLGVTGPDWSNRLSAAGRKLAVHLARKLLDRGISVIIEANFTPQRDNAPLQHLTSDLDVAVVQVLCRTEGSVLMERFVRRAESGERHPIHLEHHEGAEHFRDLLLAGCSPPLDLRGVVIDVDTTDFNCIDEEAIYSQIRSVIRGEQ
jgi:predicted kinase